MISMVVTYLTWPFLWGNPLYIFFKALKTMLAFPWIGTVRFEGLNYQASELPWYYLPKLIGIQFTAAVDPSGNRWNSFVDPTDTIQIPRMEHRNYPAHLVLGTSDRGDDPPTQQL